MTLSEVRPDGQEMFVQRGWLRASKRALDPARSTELRPFGHYPQAALNPLKARQANLTRIEINKFAHVFRAGSSLRLTIDTPSQTGYWKFGHLPDASTNSIWHDRQHPSMPGSGLPALHPCQRLAGLRHDLAPTLPGERRTSAGRRRAGPAALKLGQGPTWRAS